MRAIKASKWITGVILAALLLLVMSFGFLHRQTIKTLYQVLTTDVTSVTGELEDVRQRHQERLEQHNITIQAPTLEQTDDLLSGKVTAEEVKEALGLIPTYQSESEESTGQESAQPGAESQAQSAPSTQPSGQTESGEATAEDQATALVNQCVAELYACQVDLINQLGALKQATQDAWNALPEEQKTSEKKLAMGMDGLSQCYALEASTDAQVQGILAKYRASLTELGADTAVLDELWDYYCEEKASTKAYYLGKYM